MLGSQPHGDVHPAGGGDDGGAPKAGGVHYGERIGRVKGEVIPAIRAIAGASAARVVRDDSGG
jgi:hypothetical protein